MTAWPNQRSERREPEAPALASVPERFRRLKWNEVVWFGDFVANERLGFELWEAPGVFRAGSICEANLPEGRDRKSGSLPAQNRSGASDRRPHRCAGQLGLRRASSCVTPGKTQRFRLDQQPSNRLKHYGKASQDS